MADGEVLETRTYAKRWLMLALFVMLSMSNAGQWIQYAIISDITKAFWGVSDYLVDMTSVIYMATYIPLVLPSSWVLDKAVSRGYSYFFESVGIYPFRCIKI